MKAIQRREYRNTYTHSQIELYDDSGTVIWSCYGLEDIGRPSGIKIPEWTAIPEGSFKAKVSMSNRFKREMVMIYNQPNGYELIDDYGVSWKGLRVHAGVIVAHTEGCILANRCNNGNKYWGRCDPEMIALVGDQEFDWIIERS
jgi:hypothetical protein